MDLCGAGKESCMKIENSAVNMRSEHVYASEGRYESVSLVARADEEIGKKLAALNEKSGRSAVADLTSMSEEREKNRAEAQKQAEAGTLQNMLERMREKPQPEYDITDHKDSLLEALRQMLAALNHRGKEVVTEDGHKGVDLRSSSFSMKEFYAGSSSFKAVFAAKSQGNGNGSGNGSTNPAAGTMWTKVTATNWSFTEYESTTFEAQGLAKTQDGRSISFNVDLSMSRAFTAEYGSFTEQSFILTDPLVINLNTNVTKVSDLKIAFDLDADGVKEDISFAGEGSGFLALDANNDGVINDGSELFGTSSGDGFADLARFDDDNNGWIDENDDVFGRLRIWTKDKDGVDTLMTLKDADVGAIFLGNASTEFSLKDGANATNAVLKKTGIYLKESGAVGTVAHVDLASKP